MPSSDKKPKVPRRSSRAGSVQSTRRPSKSASVRPTAATEVGHVDQLFNGIARLRGLPHVAINELLVTGQGAPAALVIGFSGDYVEALFFDESFPVDQPVYRTGRQFSVPVSDARIGRVLDGLGRFRDGLPPVDGEALPVFRPAPPMIIRQAVTRPLVTGIKMVDATLPLGRGQRELIIGDRGVGKSTLATTMVIHQRLAREPVFCIYVLCGQKARRLEDLVKRLEKAGALPNCAIVAADADATYAEQYLAPFVGCALAEHFRDSGRDALVIYDDLSQHAKTYRDISLLLERAPGRETYPADIFSLHAGLLERAAQLNGAQGGGSLTAVPIIETQEGDLTSYLPTNIISITDGQMYMETGLKDKGYLPAINAGLSVSRLGSQVQPAPLKDVTGGLRLALAQQTELHNLTRMDTTVSKEAARQIHRGELTLELLKQSPDETVRWEEQVVLFFAVEQGFFDGLDEDQWRHFERLLLDVLRNGNSGLLEKIRDGRFSDEDQAVAKQVINDFKAEFVAA
jgi:F-type H+-transporting ATPase subunit alpha